jgi:hypothetical protein
MSFAIPCVVALIPLFFTALRHKISWRARLQALILPSSPPVSLYEQGKACVGRVSLAQGPVVGCLVRNMEQVYKAQ